MIVTMGGFLALCGWYVRWCDRLITRDEADAHHREVSR